MEEAKSSSGRLHAAGCSLQLIYDILLTMLIIWLLVQSRGQSSEIQRQSSEIQRQSSEIQLLRNDIAELRVKQSECEVKIMSEESVDVQKREVETETDRVIQFLQAFQGPRGPPGKDGTSGHPGVPGKNGLNGLPGQDGRDAVNYQSVNEHINTTLIAILDQKIKKIEDLVDSYPAASGSVYIRYGRTSCPSLSRLLYEGRLGGSPYGTKRGGSAKYICLPNDPEYSSISGSTLHAEQIYGTEYETHGSTYLGKDLHNQNVPCAVCQTDTRANSLMIPAKLHCPDNSWTTEYKGFLMSELTYSNNKHQTTEFVCVDENAEAVDGMQSDTNGALLYHTYVNCENLGHCPPYQANKVVSCVVCSK